MQQMTDEISEIKDTSVKNEEILTKIEKADKVSISKKGFFNRIWIFEYPQGGVFTSKTPFKEK